MDMNGRIRTEHVQPAAMPRKSIDRCVEATKTFVTLLLLLRPFSPPLRSRSESYSLLRLTLTDHHYIKTSPPVALAPSAGAPTRLEVIRGSQDNMDRDPCTRSPPDRKTDLYVIPSLLFPPPFFPPLLWLADTKWFPTSAPPPQPPYPTLTRRHPWKARACNPPIPGWPRSPSHPEPRGTPASGGSRCYLALRSYP